MFTFLDCPSPVPIYLSYVWFQGGFYLFTMVDAFIGGLPLLLLGIFEIAALQWVYGKLCSRNVITV